MALAMPLLIASSLLSATGSIMRGIEESNAASFQQQQLKIQEQQTRTAAQQAEARRREELTSNLETIQTIRAGRNVGLTSPTGTASMESIIGAGERDILTERINYRSRADALRMGAEMAGNRAGYSLLAGGLGAGASLTGTGYRLTRIYGEV